VSWDRTIDWANSVPLVVTAADGGPYVELARTTEPTPSLWVVQFVLNRGSMGGGAANDMVVSTSLICGNGRTQWVQDLDYTILAADFGGTDVLNRALGEIQVAAAQVSANVRIQCLTVTATATVTATIAPLGFPGWG